MTVPGGVKWGRIWTRPGTRGPGTDDGAVLWIQGSGQGWELREPRNHYGAVWTGQRVKEEPGEEQRG